MDSSEVEYIKTIFPVIWGRIVGGNVESKALAFLWLLKILGVDTKFNYIHECE